MVAGYVLAGTPLPPGYEVFQVPTSFNGIPVVTQEFVDRAHSDGYAVHVWTINDEETMNELWDYGVDGIMTAEPMRLENNMCKRDEPRPQLPKSTGGKHCSKKVSIACDVKATAIEVKGKKAKVTIARNDEYDSRCAGKVELKAKGEKATKKGKFDFGWKAPSEGGPDRGDRRGQAQQEALEGDQEEGRGHREGVPVRGVREEGDARGLRRGSTRAFRSCGRAV